MQSDQHLFMVKTLKKMDTEQPNINTMKAVYVNPMGNIIQNKEKLKAFL